MIIIDLVVLALVIAGIADVYEKFVRALRAHGQLKADREASRDASLSANASNSFELDELKDEIERLKEALKSHRHAPRRRTAGE